jgi:predicted nucleic acid-binding Zn ribbon protein
MLEYCKFCGALIVNDDILTGFCSLECQLDYEYLLNAVEDNYLQAVND